MDVRTQSLTNSIPKLLALAWLCILCQVSGEEKGRSDYREWMARHDGDNMRSWTPDGKRPEAKLVIIAVEGDSTNDKEDRSLGSGARTYGTEVSASGNVSAFSHTMLGSKGSSGGPPLPATVMRRIDELIDALPDDGERLPPAGRKLLLQAGTGQQRKKRLYDRGNAPEEVWELMRLSRCGIPSYVPEFKPQSKIDARGFEHDGFLALSPDGRQLIFTGMNAPLQFWEPITHELLAEIQGLGSRGIAFSPDGLLAAIVGTSCDVIDVKTLKTIRKLARATSSQFTPDGCYLLLGDYQRPLQMYDVRTWQRVMNVPGVPDESVKYMPAPKGKLAVVQSRNRSVSLWNVAEHREIARLAETVDIYQVAFSPDSSLVAVALRIGVLGERGMTSIGVWRTSDGKQVHELRPFEQIADEGVEGLLWSPDGQYIFAGTKPNRMIASHGINVFSARTGRHRGNFSGCATMCDGIALLPDTGELVAGSHDGMIYFWNYGDAMKDVRDFEDSLSLPLKSNERK